MARTVSISDTDAAMRRTADLLERLFPSPRSFGVRLWDGTRLPDQGHPSFHLVLNHPGALRRMFKPPIELSLSEAFILKDFDIEGDIFSVFPLMDSIAARALSLGAISRIGLGLLGLPASSIAPPQGRGPAQLQGKLHSRERDLLAVQYHYDVGNNFYSLWLDRNLQYSCGYFPTGVEELNTAQECKMEHICPDTLNKSIVCSSLADSFSITGSRVAPELRRFTKALSRSAFLDAAPFCRNISSPTAN